MTGERRKTQRRSPADHFKFIQQSVLDTTFQWFEKNVLATDQAHADSTVRRRIIVLSVITFLGSITLIIFGSLAFIQNAIVLGLVDFIFAFVLATIPSFHGYYMQGGALEVGKASTTSFVWTSVVIIILNYILTQLLLG